MLLRFSQLIIYLPLYILIYYITITTELQLEHFYVLEIRLRMNKILLNEFIGTCLYSRLWVEVVTDPFFKFQV